MMKMGVFRYWEICRHSRAHHMVMFSMLYTYRREVRNTLSISNWQENLGIHYTIVSRSKMQSYT